eukprot:2270894-Amphidinium_carterae.1
MQYWLACACMKGGTRDMDTNYSKISRNISVASPLGFLDPLAWELWRQCNWYDRGLGVYL